MSAIGYIQARVYTSSAQLPLRDAAVVITAPDNTAIAMRMSDRSGLIPIIEIPVPSPAESQKPAGEEKPNALATLYPYPNAYHNGYGTFESRNLQVFADTTTFQNIMLIPLSQLPDNAEDSMNVVTPPQDL